MAFYIEDTTSSKKGKINSTKPNLVSIDNGKYPVQTYPSKDLKNILTLKTIKHIVSKLENEYCNRSKSCQRNITQPQCCYHHPSASYAPIAYIPPNITNKPYTANKSPANEDGDFMQIKDRAKLNGLQDFPDCEEQSKPTVVIPAPPPPLTCYPKICDPKVNNCSRRGRKRDRGCRLSPEFYVQGQAIPLEERLRGPYFLKKNTCAEHYPVKFNKNPMDLLPPGTKLCPQCSEALQNGEFWPKKKNQKESPITNVYA